MRKYGWRGGIFIFLFASLMQAASYENVYEKTGISFKSVIESLLQKRSVDISYQVRITGEAQKESKTGKWCGDNFYRFKVYLPDGLNDIRVSLISSINTSYYVLVTFVHDKEPVDQIDYVQASTRVSGDDFYFYSKPKLVPIDDMGDIYVGGEKNFQFYNNLLNVNWSEKGGGWAYFQVIQATNFMESDFGHINNPKVNIRIYYEPSDDMSKFKEWLQKTKFDERTGEPIDGFSTLQEIQRYCSDFGKREVLYGIPNSDISGYEYIFGKPRDPNLPTLLTNYIYSEKERSLEFEVSLESGQKSIDGIEVEINHNITSEAVTTTGVLIDTQVDNTCLIIERIEHNISAGNGKRVLYSDNGANWYEEIDGNFKNQVTHIGYLIEKNLNANQKVSFILFTKIDDKCIGKNTEVKNKVFFGIDGVPNELSKNVYINFVSTQTFTNNSSGGTSNDYTPTYSSPSSGKSQEEIYCESKGGKIVDGVCKIPDSSSSSSPNSSSSRTNTDYTPTYSSPSSGKSQEEIYCESKGGKIVDGVCKIPDSSSSSSPNSSSSSSSSQKKREVLEIIQSLEEQRLPIKGYFIHYGKGAFDWIYVSSNNRLYKLEGMERNTGYFQWLPLSRYFSKVKIQDNKLFLERTKVREIDSRYIKTVERIAQQKEYRVNGYFTQFGEGAFDWIYVQNSKKQKMYKLNGMDIDGYFQWFPLTEYFTNISVEKNEIKVGEIQQSIKCEVKGGKWDAEEEICYVPLNSSNQSQSSKKISQSSSSSSQSSISSQNESSSSVGKDGGVFPEID